jgi:hypothetical protein
LYYESPYRLVESLDDARSVFGDRRAALANDLTKKFEAVWRGRLGDLAERVAAEKQLLGEYVLVVAGTDDEAVSARKRRREQPGESDGSGWRGRKRRSEPTDQGSRPWPGGREPSPPARDLPATGE